MADCICGANGDPKAGRLLLGCPACDKPPKLLMDQWGALKVKYRASAAPMILKRVLAPVAPTLCQQDTVAEPAVRRIDDCGHGHNRYSKECPCNCGATWNDECPEHGIPGGATFDW